MPRSGTATSASRRIVNDISQLNPVEVADQRRPRSTEDVQAALRAWPGSVSIGGGRYSMGGQIAEPQSLHLDMRAMKGVTFFDPERRVIRVQSGTTWRDIQDVIDPHDLSIKIMQSYSNFTVGGSVSVNCHGRYVGRGPLINSVRAVQVVGADGTVFESSRSENFDLFQGVFGGYGGLGVVTEVELDLDVNTRIERRTLDVSMDQYTDFFRGQILLDDQVVFHNADLGPPDFDRPRSITWATTAKPLTVKDRLIPRGLKYTRERNAIWAMTELPGGNSLRARAADFLFQPAVVWRNHEASLDTASLEPKTRATSTYLLHEYFIPTANFMQFGRAMARALKKYDTNVLNVSIRHSPADSVSLMSWARSDVFSFVLYYKQRHTDRASVEVRTWTRELVDAALANGGRYYLPYRCDATRDQFRQAYPETVQFAALKARVDPKNRFRNLLWDQYLP